MIEYGWDLEPSTSGSPSKRYWGKVEKFAEAMRARRAMDPSDLMVRMEIRMDPFDASPADGPDGNPVLVRKFRRPSQPIEIKEKQKIHPRDVRIKVTKGKSERTRTVRVGIPL